VVKAPKVEVTKPAPIQPDPASKVEAPATPRQPAMKPDEPFSFRMDKNLDVKNLETAPVEAVPAVKPKKVDVPPLPEEEPGYFERMLEKIGF
jgi:outer membrane protein assembly factor BamE